MRDNICEQIDFILQGGLWEIVTEELTRFTSSALIIEIKDEDIVVLEAVNAKLDRLMFKGIGNELLSYSPEIPPVRKLFFDSFPIPVISQLGEWTNVIRFHDKGWDIYILVMETPATDFLDAMRPFLKVISLWISLRDSSQVEEKLSALSYMILTTKNILATIFEPMSIEYFADFLRSVLRESFFAQKSAIYIDDGSSIKLLKGDDLGSPSRNGIFASRILAPTPVIYKDKEANEIGLSSEFISGKSVFILPILDSTTDIINFRLFCAGVLEKPNSQEIVNFMELLGNVASKALEIRRLHVATNEKAKQLDLKSYTVAAFYNFFQKLLSCGERTEFLSFLLSFFNETSQAEKVKLVVYDTRDRKYCLIGECLNGIAAQCFEPLTAAMERISGDGAGEIDEVGLALLGFEFKDMPKCQVYPLWIGDTLEGFVAMYKISHETAIPDYSLVFKMLCQVAARELCFRLSC